MGNVSSRPDDGAALYFKDQNRCESPHRLLVLGTPLLLLLANVTPAQ